MEHYFYYEYLNFDNEQFFTVVMLPQKAVNKVHLDKSSITLPVE